MTAPRPRRWPAAIAPARRLQERLRRRVITRDRTGRVRHVAGVDVGFENGGRVTRAAVVVLRLPDLEPCDQAVALRRTRFPYVPGFLSFREVPAILAAIAKLRVRPDLLLCDGQGLAHPRRFGLACHLGLLTGIPSVGVAKSRLIGEHKAPGRRRGAWAALRHEREIVGAVLRTRTGATPIYVSIGHRVSLTAAIRYVLRCSRYRLPETTRHAHRLASGEPGMPGARRRPR